MSNPGGPADAPGSAAASAIVRPAARVLLLGPTGAVLLFRGPFPDRETGCTYWFTPGGGVEDGETFEQAAIREVYEETGISLDALSPCIWRRAHTWQMPGMGVWIRSVERYYVARTDVHEVPARNRTELEEDLAHRWWSVAEIARSPDLFVPRQLRRLIGPVAAGRLPAAPTLVE